MVNSVQNAELSENSKIALYFSTALKYNADIKARLCKKG